MKALFFGVVTLFLIVGMSNDAQAACNAVCQANCRATHQDAGFTYEQCVAKAQAGCNAVCQAKYRATHHGGLTYEQCVAKRSKLNENPAEARRTTFPGWPCPGGQVLSRSPETGRVGCGVDWSGRGP